LFVIIGIVAIVCILVWHYRHLNPPHRHTQLLRQKSFNNDPVEQEKEILTRYRNPLFETDKGGGTGDSSPKSPELIEIDIEKYEKSPTRILSRAQLETNDSLRNTPSSKMPKIKNINVQLSRTRQLGAQLGPSTSTAAPVLDTEQEAGV
jgi:hypothetical protein